MNCEYGYGPCTAPDTQCPHWQSTFCDLDNAKAQHINLRENCANRRDDRKCFTCYWENLSTFTKEGET